jgi:putative peptidoglycan lipid II flippase
MMARWFGIGNDLDLFFVGMMIPMFLVAIFSIPLGSAFIPAFLNIKEKKNPLEDQVFVSHLSFLFTCFLGFVCIILFLVSSHLMPLLGWNFSPQKLQNARMILVLFLPVLFLSGLMLIANSLLNALGKFLFPVLFQLIVPVAAIGAILIGGSFLGIKVVAIGMIFGQVLNLLLVGIYLKKIGYSIRPKVTRRIEPLMSLLPQYVPLVFAAIFVSASIPINNAMASTLASGSVATLSLGMKVVIFLTGIVGAGFTSVMVPYFSSFIAKKQFIQAQKDLSFFTMLITTLAIPLTVLIYWIAPAMIRFLFQGGALKYHDISALTHVMQFGVLQLPFFTCGALVIKYITAEQRTTLIMLSSFIGLLINVVLNIILIPLMGTPGIALATSIAVAISTVLLLFLVLRSGVLSWLDAVSLTLNWAIFFTFITCLYFKSYAGIIVSITSYFFMTLGHSKSLFFTKQSSQQA